MAPAESNMSRHVSGSALKYSPWTGGMKLLTLKHCSWRISVFNEKGDRLKEIISSSSLHNYSGSRYEHWEQNRLLKPTDSILKSFSMFFLFPSSQTLHTQTHNNILSLPVHLTELNHLPETVTDCGGEWALSVSYTIGIQHSPVKTGTGEKKQAG